MEENQTNENVQEQSADAQEQKVVRRVESLGDAIEVLSQAADHGKNQGIFGWEDLAMILQAKSFIAQIVQAQEAAQAAQSAKSEGPAIMEPEQETKEVKLTPEA